MTLKILVDTFVMFSWQHLVTMGVIICAVLLVFLTRKFFIKYRLADIIFRNLLAISIISLEVAIRAMKVHGVNPIIFNNIPIPLCGHLLWVTSLALIANSERIMRKIYPLCLTGAILSIFIVDLDCAYPAFRVFQYFGIHSGFMIAALYFVFTRKINKFTFKDYGWSCLLLIGLGAVMNILHCLGVEDAYMTVDPCGPLIPVRDAVGQFGYTVLYILAIAAMMFVYSTLTWLGTRKRKDEDAILPEFKTNKTLEFLSNKIKPVHRKVIILSLLFAFMYFVGNQHKISTTLPSTNLYTPTIIALGVCSVILLVLFLTSIVINEVIHNYESYKKRQTISL